jgi:gas vesicle protein
MDKDNAIGFGLSFLVGVVLGAAIGAATALLLAPSSGEELRNNIKVQADTQYARLQESFQKGMQEVQNRMDRQSNDPQTAPN